MVSVYPPKWVMVPLATGEEAACSEKLFPLSLISHACVSELVPAFRKAQRWSFLIFTGNSQVLGQQSPCLLIDRDSEAQKDENTCSRSHSRDQGQVQVPLAPPYLWPHPGVRKSGAARGCWRLLPWVSPPDCFGAAPEFHCPSPWKLLGRGHLQKSLEGRSG